MRRIALIALAGVAAALTACGPDDSGSRSAEVLDLALDFQPNAAHAGIYAARSTGAARDRGIDLRIRVPASSTDSLKLLAGGRADVAVADIHDVGLAAERGADVVAIGAIVQRPLAAVIARPQIKRPRALEDKLVGVTGLPSDEAVLRAAVEADGGDFGRVRRRTIGFSAVPSLAAGKVDAVVTFWNAEGVALRERGIRTREFRVERFGAPRYPELVLVTRRSTLRERRTRLAELISALAAGTEYAVGHADDAAREVTRASQGDAGVTRAQLDAVAPALLPALKLDRRALRAWARFDARFGILERPPDTRALFVTP